MTLRAQPIHKWTSRTTHVTGGLQAAQGNKPWIRYSLHASDNFPIGRFQSIPIPESRKDLGETLKNVSHEVDIALVRIMMPDRLGHSAGDNINTFTSDVLFEIPASFKRSSSIQWQKITP